MARTAKAITALSNDAGVDSAAALSAIDVANGIAVTAAGDKDADKLVVHVKNTHATLAKNVTVKAGSVDPWSQYKGVGDLVVSVPSLGERMICLGDGSRYRQADSALWLDFEAAMTGNLAVFLLP